MANKAKRSRIIADAQTEELRADIHRGINRLYSEINHLVNFKYEMLLYKLVRHDYVEMKQLEDATGYSRQRINQIISKFEQREAELQVKNAEARNQT